MYGVLIAFKDFIAIKGITGSPWAGFKHFERFFRSFYFCHEGAREGADLFHGASSLVQASVVKIWQDALDTYNKGS